MRSEMSAKLIRPCAAKAGNPISSTRSPWPASVWKKSAWGAKHHCALLHDTVEDTDITLEDVQREFGSEVTRIVDGLTKISNVMDTNSSQQAENFKKILLTLTDDPRVILIKLADRLHNMRTLGSMKREKQLKISE